MIKKQIHLLLRFSDKLRIAGDTIPDHKKVIEDYGSVWYGKFGRPVSVHVVDKLTKQIEEEIPSFLYLVQRTKKGYETHVGTILKLSKRYSDVDKELIPPYYFNNNIIPQISLWIKLSNLEKDDEDILKRLIVSSSAMPILDSLPSSMAAHFIVKRF